MGLYNSADDLKKLRALLEGKTIERVEAGGPECVCSIKTTDGVQFSLFATDLGWWTKVKPKKTKKAGKTKDKDWAKHFGMDKKNPPEPKFDPVLPTEPLIRHFRED